MTSSLVGSEMCIRDRRAGARGCVTSASSGPWSACRCVPKPTALLCRRSVSYTHLTLPTICSV
eukprot:1286638-Prorocentrum_lima.AAC.1